MKRGRSTGKSTAESIKIISETKLIPDNVLSTVAVNMLTEAGIAPGLEAEMLEYGKSTPQEETGEDDEEEIAAAVPVKDAQPLAMSARGTATRP